MQRLVEYLFTVDITTGLLIVFVQNILAFIGTLASGAILVRLFARKRLSAPPPPVTRLEIGLSLGCIGLNTVVAAVGLLWWQHGWIVIRLGADGIDWAADCLLLMLAMDFLMYVFHRMAHVGWVYAWAHRTHHRFDNPRPLTLYALNPVEVLGFGGLWLGLLSVYSPTWIGMIVYLVLNQVFGTCGHLGVEPLPHWIGQMPFMRHLTTSTFHHQHHADREHNFGFYTTVWDRLCGTLAPDYDARFQQRGAQ